MGSVLKMRSLLILLVHALATLEINLIPVERCVIAVLGAASGNILTKYGQATSVSTRLADAPKFSDCLKDC